MSVITFSSPKGGPGKTTAACILASVLAERGATVTVIDADPNQNVVDWAALPGLPANLKVVGNVTEETILDQVDEASAQSSFVIVDLEGTASLMGSHAISVSDFVVVLTQGSQLDAKQAARQMGLIRRQERSSNRQIPFAVLFNRTNPAIQPKTLRHIEQSFEEKGIPIFKTKLCEREAYRAMHSIGGTLPSLADKGVSNLNAAITNALDFTGEVIERLRATKAMPAAQQEVA